MIFTLITNEETIVKFILEKNYKYAKYFNNKQNIIYIMYKKNMEIIIPTWNRARYLDRTLSQFANSPFREYKKTIINNNSTDNTQEVCEKYNSVFPNIKIIKNNKNIGALANILRCYEIATEKYLWLVGDNDLYDFSNCDELINIIENEDYDLIFVQEHDKINLTSTSIEEIYEKGCGNDLIMVLGTISAYILKTELYTEECIQEGYNMIDDLFPHFAFANKALKENFSVFISPIRIRFGDENPSNSFNSLGLIKGWIASNLIFEKKYRKEGIRYFRGGTSVLSYIMIGVICGKINNYENYRRTVTDLIISLIRAKGTLIGLGYGIIIEIISLMPKAILKLLYKTGHILMKHKVLK